MSACPLFVELCAGTAALSLRLHAGRNARPPVSRMGAKTGYADVILRVLGLRVTGRKAELVERLEQKRRKMAAGLPPIEPHTTRS